MADEFNARKEALRLAIDYEKREPLDAVIARADAYLAFLEGNPCTVNAPSTTIAPEVAPAPSTAAPKKPRKAAPPSKSTAPAATSASPGSSSASAPPASVSAPMAAAAAPAGDKGYTETDVRTALVEAQTRLGAKDKPWAVLKKHSPSGLMGSLPKELYGTVIAECAALS